MLRLRRRRRRRPEASEGAAVKATHSIGAVRWPAKWIREPLEQTKRAHLQTLKAAGSLQRWALVLLASSLCKGVVEDCSSSGLGCCCHFFFFAAADDLIELLASFERLVRSTRLALKRERLLRKVSLSLPLSF